MHELYAQALWEMVNEGKQPHDAVALLRKNLEAKGRSALMPKIAKAFERLAAKEARKNNVVLTIARQKDAHAAATAAKRMLEHNGLQEVTMEQKVDESLIGGWRLEGRGILVDHSWKKELLEIFERATT